MRSWTGLRTAWKEGEVRPTARPKPKQKRGRRRPDPLVAVTGQLRSWFEADPSRTGRELLERLQGEYPDCYPAGLLRTLQRRLKVWRGEMAQALVFGGAGRCDLDRTAVTGLRNPGQLRPVTATVRSATSVERKLPHMILGNIGGEATSRQFGSIPP